MRPIPALAHSSAAIHSPAPGVLQGALGELEEGAETGFEGVPVGFELVGV